MPRWLLPFLLLLTVNPALRAQPLSPASARAEVVVLLHGLGLRSWAMWPLQHALEGAGYRVLNLTYPSRRVPLEKLGGEWLPARLRERGVGPDTPVDFVTHSMGGIVLRAWLRADGVPANLGRVVMLAPPNAGSEVVDRLMGFPPFRWITSVNGPRLGTDANSFPRTLGPWPGPAGGLGIIAGDRTFNPLFHAWLRGANDGKVSVASARLDGMGDFIVLHHSHTWLAWRGETLGQVKAFLREGKFSRS